MRRVRTRAVTEQIDGSRKSDLGSARSRLGELACLPRSGGWRGAGRGGRPRRDGRAASRVDGTRRLGAAHRGRSLQALPDAARSRRAIATLRQPRSRERPLGCHSVRSRKRRRSSSSSPRKREGLDRVGAWPPPPVASRPTFESLQRPIAFECAQYTLSSIASGWATSAPSPPSVSIVVHGQRIRPSTVSVTSSSSPRPLNRVSPF